MSVRSKKADALKRRLNSIKYFYKTPVKILPYPSPREALSDEAVQSWITTVATLPRDDGRRVVAISEPVVAYPQNASLAGQWLTPSCVGVDSNVP